MSTIAQHETIADSRVAPGLPPAHLDHAAPAVYKALLSAGKEANTVAVDAGLELRIIELDATSVLSVEQHAAVRWLAIIINAFNRVAITSHYTVAPERRSVS